MKVYNYDAVTGEFISETNATPNPRVPNDWLIPANATMIEPPVMTQNEAVVFNGTSWDLVADYRERTFYDIDGNEVTLDLGEDKNAGHLDAIPQAVIDARDNVVRINAIKLKAQEYIISQIPGATVVNYLIVEMNMLMSNADLDDIVINGGTLTSEQLTEKENFRTLKNVIKTIRTMSNTAETNGDSVAKFEADLAVAGF